MLPQMSPRTLFRPQPAKCKQKERRNHLLALQLASARKIAPSSRKRRTQSAPEMAHSAPVTPVSTSFTLATHSTSSTSRSSYWTFCRVVRVANSPSSYEYYSLPTNLLTLRAHMHVSRTQTVPSCMDMAHCQNASIKATRQKEDRIYVANQMSVQILPASLWSQSCGFSSSLDLLQTQRLIVQGTTASKDGTQLVLVVHLEMARDDVRNVDVLEPCHIVDGTTTRHTR